jgi:ATP-dependent DNA helicase RecG
MISSVATVPSSELFEILARVGDGHPANDFESETLDFKQPATSPKETLNSLADAAMCFANARGGTLVLGVNDKATTRLEALVGVAVAYSIDSIRKAIFERTRPPITVAAQEHTEDGVRLILIDVLSGVAPHSNAKGLATRRLGTECLPFTPEQQRELLIARGQFDWSAEATSLQLTDLSQAEFERVRRLLREAGRDQLAGLRDKPLLEAMRLMASNGAITRAGALLLASEETLRDAIPTYGYSYQYRPSPGSEAAARSRGSRPIAAATEALLELTEARTEIRPLNVAGGVQLALSDYPTRAVREVLVNGLLHRSYEVGGTVDLEHSPERLTVRSPGGLVAGVTTDNILTHPSTPRHQLLAEAVSLLQLAERTGQGIDRAYREMLQVGKEPPAIEEEPGIAVRATLPGGIGNDAFVRFVRDLPEALSGDVEVLIALSLLRGVETLDAVRLSTAIQRTTAEAQDVLGRLAGEPHGLLEPTRRTLRKPYPSYRLRNEPLASLARAVTYRRFSLDEIDTKVVEHVREYGFITNRTLQRMFDRDLYASRNMLTDLRERGILAKEGTARGGRGVKYGPGPKFPKSTAN